MAQVRAQQ